jgi:hypothetical protein
LVGEGTWGWEVEGAEGLGEDVEDGHFGILDEVVED